MPPSNPPSNPTKKPAPSILGSGLAFKAGNAAAINLRIREIELRMSDPDYIPTAAEQSELAQLRGQLSELGQQPKK